VVRDLVQDHTPDLPAQRDGIARVEALERPAVDRDLVWWDGRVSGRPARERYALIEAEKRQAIGWLLLDHDCEVRHRVPQVGRESLDRFLNQLLEIGLGRNLLHASRLAAGHKYDPPVQKYVISELDSGQRVITERLTHVRSIALGYWIGAGSRDERGERAGVSHFIEHLLFKGSERYTAQEIAEIFDGLGGELNAATSREHTVVYARVADHHLETAIDVMSDMVYAPSFVEVDSEREVVLEEIAMYDDQPQELVHDLIAEAVFGDHPLGRPVIGTTDVISAVSRRAISAYHRSMYVPGNVVVAAAGNLDSGELLGLLERAERKVQEPPARGRRVRPPLVKAPQPSLRFTRKDTEQYHVCVAAPGIARSDRRRFAASLLDAILGGSASSRLFQEIREKRGMAYAVYSFASQYTDTGQIGFYVGTREENLEECLAIAAEQIAEVAAGNLKANELERAKENLKGRILLSMESTSNRMSRLGKSLITDTEILSMDRIIAEVDAVEPEALAELAGLLLAPDRLSAAGIGPSDERFHAAVERVSPALTAAAA
jgi:predicted Zn-dependent peptidase